MTIDLYMMSVSAPCRAVLMTAKQLDIPLNIKEVNLMKGEHLTPEYLKLNPAHTVPTIVDNNMSLWESRAIMQYLANKYAPTSSLYPSNPKKRAIVDRTLNFDMSFFATIREALLLPAFRHTDPTEQQLQYYKNNLKLLDTLIGDQKYLTGNDLTIADLSVLSSLTILSLNDYKDLSETPKLKAWFESLEKELPYYDEINGTVGATLKQFVSPKK